MNVAANEPAGSTTTAGPDPGPGTSSAPPSGTALDELPPLVESQADTHETLMTYDHHGRTPRWIAALWVIALVSLVAYWIYYAVPDLRLWMR